MSGHKRWINLEEFMKPVVVSDQDIIDLAKARGVDLKHTGLVMFAVVERWRGVSAQDAVRMVYHAQITAARQK